MNVNQLVHLPGLGDFQMSQIDGTNDPYPLVVRGNKDRRHNKNEIIDEEMLEVSVQSVPCWLKYFQLKIQFDI